MNEKSILEEAIAKQICDTVVTLAVKTMMETGNAPIEMVLDRMLTFAAAQSCVVAGSAQSAKAFRLIADKIEAGVFHSITGENIPLGERH